MIHDALGVMLIIWMVLGLPLIILAFVWLIDDRLDGLITKRIKKRFGGDE